MKQSKTSLQLQDFFIIYFGGALLTVLAQQALLSIAPDLLGVKWGQLALRLWLQDAFFLMGVVLLVRVRKESWAHLGMRRLSLRAVIESVLTGTALYLLMVLLIQLINSLWPGGLEAQNVQNLMQPDDSLIQCILVLLTMGVFVPIVEELLFRGVLFQSFNNRLSTSLAMLFTAVCFGLTHGDVQRLIPFIIGGLVLNVICVRHQSVWASAIAHGTWNSIMIIVYYMAI